MTNPANPCTFAADSRKQASISAPFWCFEKAARNPGLGFECHSMLVSLRGDNIGVGVARRKDENQMHKTSERRIPFVMFLALRGIEDHGCDSLV